MKVLVLHNNNLPSFLLIDSQIENVSIKSISVALPETDIPDFDSHISNILIDGNRVNLKNESFDIIILPYNTTENCIEYTGLRILAHLRLTREWNCLSTPILFLGPDTTDEVNQFCELGSLLCSFNVFKSSKNKLEDVLKILKWINQRTIAIDNVEDTQEYKDFLKRMKSLSAPANYATHHSLANEWAIMRWNDMLTNPVEISNNDFSKMLYYKYLRALNGDSQKIKKWLKKQGLNNLERIDDIEGGKKLVLIDDEWKKGWADIIDHIAKVSGFEFEKCEIKKEWDRDTLINEVKSFVDDNDADCYMLDLRLHDSDFDKDYLNTNNLKLSGYDILDYIKSNNEANPVIVFSASNKLWNFKKTVWDYKDEFLNEKEGAFDYILKETPESALKARESYNIYSDFVNAIRSSFKLSKLKKIVSKQNDLKKVYPDMSLFDEFVKLVLLDKGRDNHSVKKACLMTCMTFLEDYIKDRYEFISTGFDLAKKLQLAQTDKYGGATIETDVTKHVFLRREKKLNSDNYEIIDSYYTVDNTEPESCYVSVFNKDIGLLLSVLFIQYKFNRSDIKTFFLPIRNKRNAISHELNNVSIGYQELYDFYFKIIVPIIEKDNPK